MPVPMDVNMGAERAWPPTSVSMNDVAKIPDHHDMDWGQFKQHWLKRHAHLDPTWNNVAEKYDDDDAPIWWAVRNDHERIHAGHGRAPWDPPFSDVPVDHVHLPRVDPEIQRQLEELL